LNFAFTDEQQMLRETIRRVLARTCGAERVRAAWRGDPVDDVWRALADAGLFMGLAPEPLGLGLGMVDLIGPLEETGRAAVPGPVVETAAVGVPLLSAAGDPALASVMAGTERVAIAHGGRALGGSGRVYAVDLDGARRLFDVRSRRLDTVDRAAPLYEVEGRPGTLNVDASLFDRAVVGTSAQLVGLARHLLDTTVEYVKLRSQFGRPIGSFQAVKHHLADVALAVEFAAPVVYRAAWSVDRAHAERGVHASMARIYAARAAALAASKALQCHGAVGYSDEYDLHLWMKRVWALEAMWGTAAWHRARVARHLGITEIGGR